MGMHDPYFFLCLIEHIKDTYKKEEQWDRSKRLNKERGTSVTPMNTINMYSGKLGNILKIRLIAKEWRYCYQFYVMICFYIYFTNYIMLFVYVYIVTFKFMFFIQLNLYICAY